MTILDLERNDISGAVRLYREAVQSALSYQQVEDAARTLVMLQDDPGELLAKLDSVAGEARIAGILRRLKRDAGIA